jgi:hypothetical protein
MYKHTYLLIHKYLHKYIHTNMRINVYIGLLNNTAFPSTHIHWKENGNNGEIVIEEKQGEVMCE